MRHNVYNIESSKEFDIVRPTLSPTRNAGKVEIANRVLPGLQDQLLQNCRGLHRRKSPCGDFEALSVTPTQAADCS